MNLAAQPLPESTLEQIVSAPFLALCVAAILAIVAIALLVRRR